MTEWGRIEQLARRLFVLDAGTRVLSCTYEEYDAGGHWVVAEVFSTRQLSSNVRPDQRLERRRARAEWTGWLHTNGHSSHYEGDTGLKSAVDALLGELMKELETREKELTKSGGPTPLPERHS
jgi:hypothetical protein